MKKVGLSLCGGGTKAVIYLGVAQALIENDIPIDVIGGLSGGAIISALIAYGYSPREILQFSKDTNYYKLLNIHPSQSEILDHNKVKEELKYYLGSKRIEDMNIPLIIVTSDVHSKERYVIEKGEVVPALIASCALPPIIQAIDLNGRQLVDGGFSTRFAADLFQEKGANYVIGVNLDQWLNDNAFPKVVGDFLASLRIFANAITNFESRLYPIDLEINHFDSKEGILEFSSGKDHLFDVGYRKANRYIKRIKKEISHKKHL